MMEFRAATASDVELLAEMNAELIRDERHRNPMSQAELADRMSAWLAGEYRAMLFGDRAGRSFGYALFRGEPEYVYLRQFFVRPQFRRLGLGRAAIAWLHQNTWNRGRVRVEVLSANVGGIAFWRNAGFSDY